MIAPIIIAIPRGMQPNATYNGQTDALFTVRRVCEYASTIQTVFYVRHAVHANAAYQEPGYKDSKE